MTLSFTPEQTNSLWHTVPMFAVDPGKTSGWAMLKDNEFTSGQEGFYDICDIAEDLATVNGNRVFPNESERIRFVTEKFIITIHTGKNTQAPWSLETNGVLRYLALKNGLIYAEQTASQAKTFCTDDMLKALGWHKPGKVHANDAARHLVLFGLSRKSFFHPNLKQFFEPQA